MSLYYDHLQKMYVPQRCTSNLLASLHSFPQYEPGSACAALTPLLVPAIGSVGFYLVSAGQWLPPPSVVGPNCGVCVDGREKCTHIQIFKSLDPLLAQNNESPKTLWTTQQSRAHCCRRTALTAPTKPPMMHFEVWSYATLLPLWSIALTEFVLEMCTIFREESEK